MMKANIWTGEIKAVLWSRVLSLVLLTGCLSANALSESSKHLTITSTTVSNGILKIAGTNFGTYPPSVVLAGSSLGVTGFNATQIVANLNSGPRLTSGAYQLTVAQTKKNGQEEDGDGSKNLFLVIVGTCADGSGAQRYQDNADGTITDCQTGLMWEKKVNGASSSFDANGVGNCLHCVNDAYPSVWTGSYWLFKMNNNYTDDPSKAGFAGHLDWRLPTIVELQTILSAPFPCAGAKGGVCVDPVFGSTIPGLYRSSSMFASVQSEFWVGAFSNGGMLHVSGSTPVYMRVVRNAR